jgi:hypothetical protein
MTIHNGDFARSCVNAGLFFEVNPHFLLAVADVLSGIRDDSDGNRIGPFRFTQADWDASRNDPGLDGPLDSTEINVPRMQCIMAGFQARRAQDGLVAASKRYPSANELYQAWPSTPPLPNGGLQGSLNNTRALVLTAVDAALAGLDEGAVISDINLDSIAAGSKRTNAQLIITAFAAAGYGKVHQVTAVANAIAESDLNPTSVNDTPPELSVGLFQLNINGGLGSGHSKAELTDSARNTDIIIKKANTVPQFKAATNLQDAVAVFVRKIEQPANQAGEIIRRLAIAQKLVA